MFIYMQSLHMYIYKDTGVFSPEITQFFWASPTARKSVELMPLPKQTMHLPVP